MNKNKGFTLIEMMIAVAIIGILATIALPAYNGYIERGYLSQVHTELININNQIKTKLVKNPSLKIAGELKDFDTKYGVDSAITERYEFTANPSTAEPGTGHHYKIAATPKSHTGYKMAMWIDSLGNAYKCPNPESARTFSSSCEAVSQKKK